MSSTHVPKLPFFRVVLLKEMPPNPSLYKSYNPDEELFHKATSDVKSQNKKPSNASVVYLSSIIQDEHQM